MTDSTMRMNAGRVRADRDAGRAPAGGGALILAALCALGLAFGAGMARAQPGTAGSSQPQAATPPLQAATAVQPLAATTPQFEPDGGAAASAARENAAEFRTLDQQVQDLKALAVELNRDLFLLEEELLFPASTQVAVFVSMDVGEFFSLDSVELKLDGKDVTNYLYTEREVDALHRGGVHRLYAGNVRAGAHELVAVFTGIGPHGRAYRRGATLDFEKTIGPKHIELTISDRETRLQPEFVVKEWE